MFAGSMSNLGGFEGINMNKHSSTVLLEQLKDSDWSPISLTYRFSTSQASSVKFEGKKAGLILPLPPIFQVQDNSQFQLAVKTGFILGT